MREQENSQANEFNFNVTRYTETNWEYITNNVTILSDRYISDVLDKEFNSLKTTHPLLVDAPTGSGKNYFIENYLIPKAKLEGKKVLILSNRIATDTAAKKRIAKLTGSYNVLNRNYTDEGISTVVNNIGTVTVMTYHKFLYDTEVYKSSYDYIIVDECHYFWSDSAFNPHTFETLNKIVKYFQDSIRFYMSATPEHIFPIIKKLEETYHPKSLYMKKIEDFNYINHLCRNSYWCEKQLKIKFKGKDVNYCMSNLKCTDKIGHNQFQFFRFARNYNYIKNVYSVKEYEELDSIISNMGSDEKILIFTSSKQKGEMLMNKYKDSIFISAESKSKNKLAKEEYKHIITGEKFSAKVLIATSVIDNGINIKDISVKKMFIDADNKETFVQMLGRLRISDDKHKIDLYIKDHDISELNNKIRNISKYIDAFNFYSDNGRQLFEIEYFDNPEKSDIAQAICHHSITGILVFNDINLAMNKAKHKELVYIKNLINEKKIKSFTQYVVENWLSLEYEVEKVYDAKEVFEYFLNTNVDKTVDSTETAEFSKKFVSLYIKAYGTIAQPNRPRGYAALNSLLKNSNLEYILEEESKAWTLKIL